MTEPAEVEALATGPSREREPAKRRKGVPPALKIGIVLTALSSAIVFLLLRSPASESLSYSKLVHEVVDNPGAFEGRQLRVEGQLRQGSIQFREEPCEWRFVIESQGRQLPVAFPECIVPDTFKDSFGIQVTVQGHLEANGSFLANEVIPRCPSKYEMQQQLESGQTMPHPPAEATTAPAVVPAAPGAAPTVPAAGTPPG
jgi:cytochrome c-type biogenesis protein CcmE